MRGEEGVRTGVRGRRKKDKGEKRSTEKQDCKNDRYERLTDR